MKPTFVLLAAVLAATAAPAESAAPVTRSATGWSVRLTPRQLVDAARATDRVFRDNLDGAGVAVYTDRAAFLAALAPGYVENPFDDVVPGMAGGLEYTQDGYEYTIFSQFGAHGGLYNGAGVVSTDRVDDAVAIYFFSGAEVHALGGTVWPSDFLFRPVAGSIEIYLGDGTTETLTSTGAGQFRGFVSAQPIQMVVIDAPDLDAAAPGESPDRWATLDDLVIGNVP